MEFRNGVLLQLFECIESTQNEVKRKMIETLARNGVPKSPAWRARKEKLLEAQWLAPSPRTPRVIFAAREMRKRFAKNCWRDCGWQTHMTLSAIY